MAHLGVGACEAEIEHLRVNASFGTADCSIYVVGAFFFAKGSDLREFDIEEIRLLVRPQPSTQNGFCRFRTIFCQAAAEVPLDPVFEDGMAYDAFGDCSLVLTLPHTICTCVVFGEWRQLLLPTRLAGPASGALHKADKRDMLGIKFLARALGVNRSRIFKPAEFEPVPAPIWNFSNVGSLASFLTTLTSNLHSADDKQELHAWITSLKGFG